MQDLNIVELTSKYLAGNCTDEEAALLESWYLEWEPGEVNQDLASFEQVKAEVFARLPVVPAKKQLPIFSKYRILAAASLTILLSAGLYLYYAAPFSQKLKKEDQVHLDISAGKNSATLTLANGKVLQLSDTVNGTLAKQDGITITKSASGQIIYSISSKGGKRAGLQYNTLSTARGEQFQLILPDGTHAWLNAASSITYPVHFAESERRLKVMGEAYFEVAHNKFKPFIVSSERQQITVLGTHFNINSYPDESTIKTTLLEGSVKVATSQNESVVLKPGQESQLNKSSQIKISPADIEETMAWQNGYFRFNDEKIESIMRKLSRWYNIEVVYQGPKITYGFTGKISRTKSIGQVLKMLEKTKTVHFKIEERRVTVML